ncbi:hypothetical protein SNE40_022716 [Patella caerulea]|uniref:Uncharacterized protein n=1 Tax=Patella caerulea TaxID=87958 RepID=A0AAN8IVB5_PATCE
MRTLPKTTKGSSVIRRDGSVVIMKAGKIVSVREAKNFTHGLPTMGRNTNGSPRFTNGNYKRDLHDEEYSNGFEMKNVLPATYPLSTIYSDSHIQLSESDGDQSSQEVPSSEVPDIIFDFEELDTELGASDIMTEEDNNILSKMPLTPHTKCELTKSAMCLKTESECANKTIPEKVSQKLKAASVSSLTRLRNLEISSIFGKSGSDKKLNLYGSPLLLRRLENRKSSLPLLGNHASEM